MTDVQPKASHFIDGAYVEDTAGAAIDVIYPANGKKIAKIHSANPKIIVRAVESGRSGSKIRV